MLVVRSAGSGDLDMLLELARLSGRGFTSLPEDRDTLAERLTLSEASFAGRVAPTEAWYTLMLEDLASGEVLGVAGVRAAIGLRRPHFSFRVVTLAQYSSATGTRFDHRALVLVNECSGHTEVGSLFLRPGYRRGGAGALLARSRYLLIAADRSLFAQTVLAELRGWFDDDDRSPFWEHVAAKFYRLPFEEADGMIVSTDGQFLLDLAPRHPIYLELVDPAARNAVGAVHRDGVAAKHMLEREGFRWSELVDMFDGGPTVTCDRDSLATIARTQRHIVRIGPVEEGQGCEALVSTAGIGGFRATRARIAITDGGATIDAATARGLELAEGATIQISA